MRNLTLTGAAILAALTFAACGGGGGGSTPSVPTPIVTATPAPTPTSTIGAVSTPTPSTPTTAPTTVAAASTISGTVVDYTTGAPVSGATVGTSAQGSAIAGSGTTIATTASDGTFSATMSSSGPIVLVISASGRATIHKNVTLTAGANAVGTLKQIQLSAEDLSEITLINQDRASHGGAPAVTPDEIAMEMARFHANDMAGLTGLGPTYFSHNDRNGVDPNTRYQTAGGIGGDSETLCAGIRDFANCEAAYISEGPPASGTANHYSIIVNPAQVWVGVATATAAPVNGFASSVYDEEYIQYPF